MVNAISRSASSIIPDVVRRAPLHLTRSIGAWSGVILGASVMSLAGLGAYRWSQSASQQDVGTSSQVKNFEATRTKVFKAYACVFGGFAMTGVSALIAHAVGASFAMMTSPYLCVGTGLLAIGSVVVTMLSEKDSQIKNVAWVVFNVSMGLTLSPLMFIDKTILFQAATITMGLGGLISLSALLAPDRSFLKWESPLLAAFSALAIGSTAALLFPRSLFAYGLDRVSLYGGLALYSVSLFVGNHRLVADAEKQSDRQFDPINSSLNIYIDTLNIFVRVVRILLDAKED